MSRRTIVSLTASVIVGVAFVATVSSDALAKKAVRRPVAAVAVAPAPVAVAVIGNNYGPVADRVPRCFDSAIWYPTPPCY